MLTNLKVLIEATKGGSKKPIESDNDIEIVEDHILHIFRNFFYKKKFQKICKNFIFRNLSLNSSNFPQFLILLIFSQC